MTFFQYKAKNRDGVVYERTLEARDRTELFSKIREEGGSVVSVKEVEKKFRTPMFSKLFGGMKEHEKIVFARNLGAMIKAGLSVTRALSVMDKQAKNKKFKKLLNELSVDVSKGDALSDAMKRRPAVFSPLFVSMVRSGEESGNVANSLTIVAGQMEKTYLLMKKVKGAFIYPAVILTLMVILAILMLIFMVPTLTATFQGVGLELPLSTRIIVVTSGFLVSNTLLVLVGLLLLVFGVIAFLNSNAGKRFVDNLLVRIPVVRVIVREVESARTARTLSSLLSSGVDIVVALDVTRDVMQNHLYKDVLGQAYSSIQKGEQISQVFTRYPKLYPAFISEMVAVGEETGKISDMLLGVANYYESEVDQKTKDLSTIIEPVLMVMMGIGVGLFAIAMLAPTYSLVEQI